MSKVLILANNATGLFNFRKELLESLLRNGYTVELSLPSGSKVESLVSMGCRYFETALDRRSINPIKDLKLLFHYIRIIRESKPDIVLTYTIKPNVYGGMVCSLLKVPYLCNITGLGTAIEKKSVMKRITLTLYRIALNKAQTIFFQNNENLGLFTREKIAKENYILLPGSGVNLNSFKPLEYPKTTTNVDFIFIGRLMEAKGIEEYFTAAREIRSNYPNSRFHVCGFCEQGYESKVKELHERGVVIYHGIVDNVFELLKSMHCTIQPSHHEGMSNTVLESAAAARPVIATDIPGCREAVDDGVNGYLFPKGDATALVKRIERFIAIPWEEKREMGLSGRRKMEKEFDRSIVVDAYLKEISTSVKQTLVKDG